MKTLGPYRIVQRIASGGMGEIYLATLERDGGFEKRVALKRILPHLSQEPNFIKMFEAEARLSALLNHRNIVHVYDFGREEDGAWIAMEFINGLDVRRLMDHQDGRSLPMGIALTIASQCARGLDYAYRCDGGSEEPLRIIHRDISPQNILVSFEGEVKLTDFGLAKACSLDTWSLSGMLKGKLAYMAPEQISGAELDARTDIFSLGLVLYEMLSGQRCYPLNKPVAHIMDLARRAEFTPLAQVAPDLPQAVVGLVTKCLELEAGDRFQTSAELERDIRRVARAEGCDEPSYSLADFLKPISELRRQQQALAGEKTAVSDRPIVNLETQPLGRGTRVEGTTAEVGDAGQGTQEPRVSTGSETLVDHEANYVSGTQVVGAPPVETASSNNGASSVRGWQLALSLACVVGLLGGLGLWMSPPETTSNQPRLETKRRAPAKSERQVRRPETVKNTLTKAKIVFQHAPKSATCFVWQTADIATKTSTPCHIPLELVAGDYRVSAQADGYQELAERLVKLSPATVSRVDMTMKLSKAKQCSVSIVTQPSGATVFVDGRRYETASPLLLSKLSSGQHELVIQKAGFRTLNQTLLCNDNTPKRLDYSLEEQRFVVLFGGKRWVLKFGAQKVVSKSIGGLKATFNLKLRSGKPRLRVSTSPHSVVYANQKRQGNVPVTMFLALGRTYTLQFESNARKVGSLRLRVSHAK